MVNIETLLKNAGVDLPEDKKDDFLKAFNENYKTVNEFDKKVKKLEGENEQLQKELDTANESLNKLDGIDPDKIKLELEAAKKRADDLKAEYDGKLAEREKDDLLKEAMDGIEFTSSAAKKSIMAQIKADVTVKNGKLIGFNDLLESIKAEDSSAFVTKEDKNKSTIKITEKMGCAGNGGNAMTKEDINKITNPSDRIAAIAKNLDLYKAETNQ